jgi:NhaA family Na+:H+ antiporter
MMGILKRFLAMESASGLVLMAVALLAMLTANSPLSAIYQSWAQTSSHVINDGLMTLFFLLVGAEIKRELTQGALATRAQAMLPIIAACGGVTLPAIIYSMLTQAQKPCAAGRFPPRPTLHFRSAY